MALLHGIGSSGDCELVTFAKLWMLRSMTTHSDAMRSWVLDARGLSNTTKVLVSYLLHDHMLKQGLWMVFMPKRVSSTKQAHSQFAAVSKMVYSRLGAVPAQQQTAWCRRFRTCSATIRLPLDTMLVHPNFIGVLSAACSALNVNIEEQPNRAQFFIGYGAAELVLGASRVGQKASDTEGGQCLL